MSQQIHRSWLQPTPSYWQMWSYRDDPRLDPDAPLPISTEPKVCIGCHTVFTPASYRGAHRVTCGKPECDKARKRRNARLSAQRVTERQRGGAV